MIAPAQDRSTAVLASLVHALAVLDRVPPVAPNEEELHAALGHILAEDAKAGSTLRLTGARLRRIDLALLASLGVERVAVRTPHILVTYDAIAQDVGPVARLISGAIEAEGGTTTIAETATDDVLESARKDPHIDAVIAICEDDGRMDTARRALARIGRVEFDGVALSPGGSIAFGFVDSLPVLLLPGQMNATLVAWLAVGRRLLARLSFRLIEEQPFLLELARTLASPRGTAEVIPVRRRAAQVEPLTGDIWSPQSMARADGWILIPAETESLPAGSKVQMRPWP